MLKEYANYIFKLLSDLYSSEDICIRNCYILGDVNIDIEFQTLDADRELINVTRRISIKKLIEQKDNKEFDVVKDTKKWLDAVSEMVG